MIGKDLALVRTWQCAVLCFSLLAGVSAQQAAAADCPGHPDALGTSRTLVVDPRQYPIIGTMQYAKTLPLEDHEVVLTFDDGPLPKYSNQILDILASHCAKATFFLVGRQANANPEGVRKVRDAGHTVATHTQNHPANMHRLPIERAKQEIDGGIASVTAALADGTAPAPFFRIPGLARADDIEEYAASKGIQIWSADFPADDWRNVSAARVYDLAIKRLEAKGKGILLLHDIQARTVAALPRLLNELKARGYRIVHVVPATPTLPATPTEPQQWQLHPPSENVAISHWPKIPNFVFAATEALPAPAVSDSYWNDAWPAPQAKPLDRARRHTGAIPLPRQAPWPRQITIRSASAATALPAPAQGIFEMRDKPWTVTRAVARSAGRTERVAAAERETDHRTKLVSAEAGASRRMTAGKSRQRHAKRPGASDVGSHGSQAAAHAGKRTLKRLVQVKKRSV
jgi:peptidoglycan/xylan/chitin deacetylase (PgdA/CDA1 family)